MAAGSYTYMCGHSAEPERLRKDDSPLRAFLYHNGPSAQRGADAKDDLENVDRFFACGHRISDMDDPGAVPVVICNSFGAHAFPPNIHWERGFLPRDLGGSGANMQGGAHLVFADGHTKWFGGEFPLMMRHLGVTEARLPARAAATYANGTRGG